MAGICGVVSKEDCVKDLYLGTFYLQHRAQDYCALALNEKGVPREYPHRGLIRQQFPEKDLKNMKSRAGIGCVASERQPVSILSKQGGMILGFDGNIINYEELKNKLLGRGDCFSGYKSPDEVRDAILISSVIAKERNFEEGIEKLIQEIEGDFSIVALNHEGVYAARGFGRKPLILGKKDGSYAVSSESNSFVNTGFEIFRDVEPGEIILLNETGINSIKKLDLKPIKYGTFEWIYTAHPASIIDRRNVAEVRQKIGALLSRRFPVDADFVSPVPNSGRWHAIGYSQESKIPYTEVFVRYDYSDRSYTPSEQEDRNMEAKTKLIPIQSVIEGNKLIIVDDSIVRGTQMLNRVETLKNFGAKEVHARIACPPLMAACKYGKTTRKDEECIAGRMGVNKIQSIMNLDSLGYATLEDLEMAIGMPREKLCLECWALK